MSIIESILNSIYLQLLQLCLGLWQIVKDTREGAFIIGIIACLLLPLVRLLQRLGPSPTIDRLQCFPGRLFKRVRCHVMSETEPMGLPCRPLDDRLYRIQSQYLGKEFVVERKEGNKLFVNEKMSYYITDVIWASLANMAKKAPDTVFLTDYKQALRRTVVGRVMRLEEVLDFLVLENQDMKALDNVWLLPVNLSVSSDDLLLSISNLLGIFLLSSSNVYWLIPSLLSITSGVLEFSTTLRKWLYGMINIIFCSAMHLMCDQLPYSMRRRVYVFGCWLENLKPSNDIKYLRGHTTTLRVLRGHTISAVIAGGAKAYTEDATLVPDRYEFLGQADEEAATLVSYGYQFSGNELEPVEVENTFKCEHFDLKCKYRFDEGSHEYRIEARRDGMVIIDFAIKCKTSDEFMKMCTLISCISKNHSGSLEREVHRKHNRWLPAANHKKLRVRPLRESILCYVRNGYPPIYSLEFQNATVL